MSHRTGLPRHDASPRMSDNLTSMVNCQDDVSPAIPGAYEHGQITKVKYQRPSAEFRDIWQYNNNMYMILSYLPTALLPSKIPFARYAKEHILDPLGMTSTTYSSQAAAASGQLADGIARQVINTGDEKVIFRALPYWFPSGEDGNSESLAVLITLATHSVTAASLLWSRWSHQQRSRYGARTDIMTTCGTDSEVGYLAPNTSVRGRGSQNKDFSHPS